MEHPEEFLLKAIIYNKTNGLPSLGDFHAKHVDDIAKVMESFAINTIADVCTRIDKGEQIAVMVGGKKYELKLETNAPHP